MLIIKIATLKLVTMSRESEIFVAQNFHEFHEQIFLCESVIMNITAYSVIIFFDTFLIRETKNAKILFSQKLISS